MQLFSDIWRDSAYRGGRMTKLTNCSIMAPPGGARCSYAARLRRAPAALMHHHLASVVLSELRPPPVRWSPPKRNESPVEPPRISGSRARPLPRRIRLPEGRGSGRGRRWLGRRGERSGREGGGRGWRWPWTSERMIRMLMKRR